MKIRVDEKITVDVKITQTMVCPAGTAYWTIDYLIDGICVHSATTGAIYGSPNPIEMLDRKFTYVEYHYQGIPNADPEPTGEEAKGRNIQCISVDGKRAWKEEKGKTHRQAIIEAVSQIVTD